MITTNIEFINHASVLVSCGNIKILSDPWYKGSVFHYGWKLLHELEDDKIIDVLNKTTHIYISHEHPDHFNPTFLTNKNVKNILINKNIEILFQNTKDKRVINFLKKNNLRVKELSQDQKLNLSQDVEIQIIRHDFYDSSLIIKTPSMKILNLNDCPLREKKEIKKFRKKYGSFDVLLTQFSYAAWKGGAKNKIYRENAAKEKLESIEKQAIILEAKSVIPFASFIYFSNELNFYMNDSINTPENVKNNFLDKKFKVIILSPGEIQDLNNLKQNQTSLDFWKDKYNMVNSKPKDLFKESSNFSDLKVECNKYNKKIFKKNSKLLIYTLKKLKIINLFQSLNIKLNDHNKIYNYCIFNGLIESSTTIPDVSMHSQSLEFIFKNEFGFDTLTVNGCFESNQKGFSKLAKTFGLGSLNTLGLSLNISLLTKPKIIFLFFNKLKNVLKKLI